jgi:TonB family protein
MNSRFAVVIFALMAAVAAAQEAASHPREYHQKPDQDGVYYVGPEVSAPRIVRAILAQYPDDLSPRELQGFTVMAMVIDPSGKPQHIQILHKHGDECDRSAFAAVRQSTFAPGTLAGKPVPVWIDVRVVFRLNHADAVPQVLITERDLPLPDESHFEDKHHNPLSYTEPIPIHTVDADFADPYTNHPYVQVAWVEVTVGVDGLPKEVHVRRGLGFGMDEKATAAVKHYRFLPAMKKGIPIEASRIVMVNFAKF